MAAQPAKRLTELDFWGPEPSWTGVPDQLTLIKALNWYSARKDPTDAHGWLVEHLESTGQTDWADLARLYLSPLRMPPTLGWIARVLSRGQMVSADLSAYYDKRLVEVISEAQRRRVEVINQEETKDSVQSPSEPKPAKKSSKRKESSAHVHLVRNEGSQQPPSKRKRSSKRRAAPQQASAS